MFASSVLVTDALVVLFAGLVAHGLELAPTAAILWGGGALMLGAIVATGLLRRGVAGYVLGSMLQVLIVATGIIVPMMFVVGAIFAVLWLVSLRIGGRIDADRLAWERGEQPHAEPQPTDPA